MPSSGRKRKRKSTGKEGRHTVPMTAGVLGLGKSAYGPPPFGSKGTEQAQDVLNHGRAGRSALQQELEKRLLAGQFRHLNETMYKSTGDEAWQMMQEDPALLLAYHEGYAEQARQWPVNPLDAIVEFVHQMSKKQTSRPVVADFGCGEAMLALQLSDYCVHSFDLCAINSRVVACDMAHVPLEADSIDLGVFCLSLMGINYADYLLEARRVLRLNATLVIVEVRSRFSSTAQAKDDLLPPFCQGLTKLGFKVEKQKDIGNFFVWFSLRISKKPPVTMSRLSFPALRATSYKRR
mmetsp:Transcript_4589/g.9186  ORF Transcript_4589/g.9186 Transcript_4589/m.9186 type:complete len:293 (-) Transcript_4589:894-1772(-)